jgi:hypothetical protein
VPAALGRDGHHTEAAIERLWRIGNADARCVSNENGSMRDPAEP